MTLYQFNQLDEKEQAEIVWSGKHIGSRHDEKHDILLYQIDGFFVEVFYRREYYVIRKFEPVTNKNQLSINEIDHKPNTIPTYKLRNFMYEYFNK